VAFTAAQAPAANRTHTYYLHTHVWLRMCLPVDSTQFPAISVSFSRRSYDFHTALA